MSETGNTRAAPRLEFYTKILAQALDENNNSNVKLVALERLTKSLKSDGYDIRDACLGVAESPPTEWEAYERALRIRKKYEQDLNEVELDRLRSDIKRLEEENERLRITASKVTAYRHPEPDVERQAGQSPASGIKRAYLRRRQTPRKRQAQPDLGGMNCPASFADLARDVIIPMKRAGKTTSEIIQILTRFLEHAKAPISTGMVDGIALRDPNGTIYSADSDRPITILELATMGNRMWPGNGHIRPMCAFLEITTGRLCTDWTHNRDVVERFDDADWATIRRAFDRELVLQARYPKYKAASKAFLPIRQQMAALYVTNSDILNQKIDLLSFDRQVVTDIARDWLSERRDEPPDRVDVSDCISGLLGFRRRPVRKALLENQPITYLFSSALAILQAVHNGPASTTDERAFSSYVTQVLKARGLANHGPQPPAED